MNVRTHCKCGKRLKDNEWRVCRQCVQMGLEVDSKQNTLSDYLNRETP